MSRPTVDPGVLRDCTRVSPWKSLALCIVIHLAAVGLVWIGGDASGWKLAVPAAVLIAALQMHLLILMHEGAHLLLHPDRRLNDLIGDVFCAIPCGLLLKHYRCIHLNHHRYASSPERDPEVLLYRDQGFHYARQQGWPLVRMLLADVSGIGAIRFLLSQNRYLAEQRRQGKLKAVERHEMLLMAIAIPLVGLAVRFDFWRELLVLWALPQFTLTFLFLKLHGYGEHTGATGPTEYERTWVHAFTPVTDFFLYPIYSGYHLEHHFFPRVPWYHMARFRRALMSDAEYARRSEPVTVRGYFLGARSIWNAMLLGEGEYRVQQLAARTDELGGDVITSDTRDEVDEQLALIRPAGEGASVA
ncbi:MAG: fatty acid desaturase [bacterium]|nr:fatty acid desaturase [bacterium]